MKGMMKMLALRSFFDGSGAYHLLNICAGGYSRNTTERGGANCVRSDTYWDDYDRDGVLDGACSLCDHCINQNGKGGT